MSATLGKAARARSLPEHAHYADTGCALAPSCLACPLVVCRHDDPFAVQRTRNEKLLAAFEAGSSIDELTEAFGISKRTVFNVLRGRE